MRKYITQRLLHSIVVFFIATTICYAIFNIMPGDAVTYRLGAQGTTAQAELMRKSMGLDKSVIQRYVVWLKSIVTGDFGISYMFGIPVTEIIKTKMPYTLLLTGASFFSAMIFSLLIGITTAVKRNSRIDHILSTISLIGVSIPEIWVGYMVVILCSRKLELLPYIGQAKFPQQLELIDYLKMSLIPFIILTMGYIGGSVRYIKSGVQEVLVEQYITAAKARGIDGYRLLFKHVLKNAAKPIITHISNVIPSLISSTIIIEKIFNCPGIGSFIIYANWTRDYPVLMGIVVFTILVVVVTCLLADIFYLVVDPRIQYE